MTKKTDTGVRIRYTGKAKRRVVTPYEWNRANGYVQTVHSTELAERLLANGDFVQVQVAHEPIAAQESKEQTA